jgi:hypothetical protein
MRSFLNNPQLNNPSRINLAQILSGSIIPKDFSTFLSGSITERFHSEIIQFQRKIKFTEERNKTEIIQFQRKKQFKFL